jgi:hypothetical protein
MGYITCKTMLYVEFPLYCNGYTLGPTQIEGDAEFKIILVTKNSPKFQNMKKKWILDFVTLRSPKPQGFCCTFGTIGKLSMSRGVMH